MRWLLISACCLSLAVPVMGADRPAEGDPPARSSNPAVDKPARDDSARPAERSAVRTRSSARPERQATARSGRRPDTAGLRRTSPDYALSPQQAMSAQISEVRFEATPLREAFNWLAEVLGTNMHVDWGALNEAGVSPDTPIDLNLRWVRVPQLLRFMFQETGRGEELAYHISGNVLVITSRAKADEELFTRVYPVQDLLIRPSRVDRVDRNILTQPGGTRTGRGMTGTGSGGLLGGSDSGRDGGLYGRRDRRQDEDEEDSPKARGEEVITMIKNLTPADIWEENGGRAKATVFRGNLILTAPRSVHALIAGPIRE